ncbi:uncharacterized protein B0H18DRAFT_964656, partial [Fomitopsis serialis]|uniref:uncharacterized protein n=1 Tax=Fomitopsis serialis TaxID=139415 RepID=UPI0020077E0B
MCLDDREVYRHPVTESNEEPSVEEDWVDIIPPGEEGTVLSGEDELCRTIFLEDGVKRKRRDIRSRKNWVAIREKEWREQQDDLVEGYLAWRAGDVVDAQPEHRAWPLWAIDFF